MRKRFEQIINMKNYINLSIMARREYVKITVTAALWMYQQMRDMIEAGIGDEENGLVDEISPDTELYRWVNNMIRMMMTVSGVIRNDLDSIEMEAEDQENLDPN